MKTTTILIVLIITSIFANAQAFEWAEHIGGTGDNYSESIAVDTLGDIYTVGHFTGTVDFDPNAGIYNLTSAGGSDIYIAKYDSLGNFIWAKQIGGITDDKGYSIIVDSLENIIITGFFSAVVDFDPNAGVYNLTSAGGQDAFVVKLDVSGNLVWAKQFGGANNELGKDVDIDPLGNIYTTGYLAGPADFDPGVGTYNLGGNLAYVSKLDAAGNFVWATDIEFRGTSLTVDVSGNVYITGYFDNTIDANPTTGVYNLTSISFGHSTAITKLSTNGVFQWAKGLITSSWIKPGSIIVDKLENVYVTGEFKGTVDFDPGPAHYDLYGQNHGYDGYLVKLNILGNFEWARAIGGISSNEIGISLALDDCGNIYVTGRIISFWVGAYYGSGIYKFNTSGAMEWQRTFSTWVGGIYENDIVVDDSLNIYTTGYFEGSNDQFDTDGGGTCSFSSLGNSDIFIHKLRQMPDLLDFNATDTCFNDNTIFTIVGMTSMLSFEWDFDDPASGAANTSVLPNPTHQFTATGTYNVQLIVNYTCGFESDTIIKQVSIYNCTLPVELLSFTGEHMNDANQLNWTTAIETNNDYFTLERSLDAENWETIAIIDGAGNSNQTIEYSYNDYSFERGINYYRLKQTDYDATETYFNIVSIETDNTDNYSAYYNNQQGNIQISLPNIEGENNIQLIDYTGKLIYNVTVEGANKHIISENLTQGIYILLIYNKNGIQLKKKIFSK